MPDTPTVLLIGTLDTKGHEYAYLRDRLLADGVDVLVVDVGINDPDGISPDISRHEVAASVGADADALSTASDRGQAVATMTEAAAEFVPVLYREGHFDGVLAAGGSGGTADRDPCHAGSAGWRPQTDALDHGFGEHFQLRGEQ